MGELRTKQKTPLAQVDEAMVVETMGGRIHVQWDQSAQATPHGQLVFFAEFLNVAGVFDDWVDACPLSYTSGNASDKRDVLGTVLLGILAGNKRYAHLSSIRGDAVAAKALGLSKLVSPDAVRRALMCIDQQASAAWMRPALMNSVLPALDKPWVLDIDTTIKTLFGHQEGAQVSYNPHKPGRPSHALHTYWVGNLRLVLDVQLSAGKQHTSAHAKEGLCKLLDELPLDKRPYLLRGDCAFGNEPMLIECEQRKQPYLFRLKQTARVKQMLVRLFNRSHWTAANALSQGWQATEDRIKLTGWTQERRVVVLRRRIQQDVVLTSKAHAGSEQLTLALACEEEIEDGKLWEYTVLISNVEQDLQAIAQLYRDRCDCENGFDELKNQWGWGGFTTQDLNRNQTMARTIALIYNWWSWYARAGNPGERLEAMTSRPLLLAAVGRAVSHAGQTMLYLTLMHAKMEKVKSLIANIRAALNHVRQVARQFKKRDTWATLLTYISDKIVHALSPPPQLLIGLRSG